MAEVTDFELYRYSPSMAAAIIFIILFLIVTAIHSYQLLRTRLWIFIPFVLGGFCTLCPSPQIVHSANRFACMQSNGLDISE